MLPARAAVVLGAAAPVAERYWMDQPSSVTGASEVLYNSTNLFLKAAPALPPLRYASLMTTGDVPAAAGEASSAAAGTAVSGAAMSPADSAVPSAVFQGVIFIRSNSH